MPSFTDAAGEPEIFGGEFVLEEAETVIENAGSVADALPSETVMRMLLYVPTFASEGVPNSCPVVKLKLSQAGLLPIA